jgi:regulator of nonsense transcripts 1
VQVVRLASQRAQVNIGAAVEHLSLHYQVENLHLPGKQSLHKLIEQKKEEGDLSLENERRLRQLWRQAEAEILAEADVVCVTCIGAGDKRLRRLRFPRVRLPLACQPRLACLAASLQTLALQQRNATCQAQALGCATQ